MKYLILLICLFSAGVFCHGQTSTYDLASFTAPKGWSKTMNTGVVLYNSPKNDKGGFCLISIYQHMHGTGDLTKDFNKAWQELIASRLSVTAKPSIDKGEPDNGWNNLTGTASFTQQGANMMAILTTMSGYHTAMNIVVVLNDQSYLAELDGFYKSVTLKKPDQLNNALQEGTVSGLLSDYEFTAPPGWSKENNASEIVLRGPDHQSVISILPMQPSSGNLETDMSRVFWQVFGGWEIDRQNIDHHIYSRGVAPAGWNYLKQELGISKTENGQLLHLNGFVLLAQLNNQVAIIAGSYPVGGSLLNESLHVDWQLFFHSLDFRNYPRAAVNPLATDILGEWLTGSSTGLATYTFAANGHYSNGSAYRSQQDISAYRILEKTTSFVGDGRYQLKGNELTLIPTRTNKPEAVKVRVFYKNEFLSWIRTIGMIFKSTIDGHLYELTMVIQEKK